MTAVSSGREVTKRIYNRKALESAAIVGDSPVGEMNTPSCLMFPSTTEHEEFRGNLGGPSPKAKYKPMTDSVPVP